MFTVQSRLNLHQSRQFYKQNCQNFQRLHPLGLHQGFTLNSFGVVVNSIPRSPVELHFSMPTAFELFAALMNVQQLSACHFDHCNIFLNNKFCLALQTKFLKISKKTTYKTFTKILFSFPWFLIDCQFEQTGKRHLQKHFILYF